MIFVLKTKEEKQIFCEDCGILIKNKYNRSLVINLTYFPFKEIKYLCPECRLTRILKNIERNNKIKMDEKK